MKRQTTQASILFVMLTLLSVSVAAATDAELLEIVKQGTQQRYESIRTFKGSVGVENISTPTDGSEMRHQRKLIVAFDGCRVKVSSALDYVGVFDGSNTTEWLKASPEPAVRVYEGLAGFTGSDFHDLDPRARGIKRLGDGYRDLTVIAREPLNGDDCIVLQYDVPNTADYLGRGKVWVNVDGGFTIPKQEVFLVSVTTGAVVAKIADYLSEVKECGTDMWLPTKWIYRSYGNKDGTVSFQQTITYDPDFQINVPIAESDLKLALPSGLSVSDEVLDAEYTTP